MDNEFASMNGDDIFNYMKALGKVMDQHLGNQEADRPRPGRGRKKKEKTLMEQLQESWGGKTYLERLDELVGNAPEPAEPEVEEEPFRPMFLTRFRPSGAAATKPATTSPAGDTQLGRPQQPVCSPAACEVTEQPASPPAPAPAAKELKQLGIRPPLRFGRGSRKAAAKNVVIVLDDDSEAEAQPNVAAARGSLPGSGRAQPDLAAAGAEKPDDRTQHESEVFAVGTSSSAAAKAASLSLSSARWHPRSRQSKAAALPAKRSLADEHEGPAEKAARVDEEDKAKQTPKGQQLQQQDEGHAEEVAMLQSAIYVLEDDIEALSEDTNLQTSDLAAVSRKRAAIDRKIAATKRRLAEHDKQRDDLQKACDHAQSCTGLLKGLKELVPV